MSSWTLALGSVGCDLSFEQELRVERIIDSAWVRPWHSKEQASGRKAICLAPRAQGLGYGSDIEPIDESGTRGFYRWDADYSRLQCYIADSSNALWSALMQAVMVGVWQGQGIFLHGAGLRLGEAAVAALAPSGGGKSTLVDLADGVDSFSDETLLIEPVGGESVLHGVPFSSSAKKRPVSGKARLRALLLLDKSPTAEFSRVSANEALLAISRQIYRPPKNLISSAQVFRRAKLLVESVPAYRFRFPKTSAAADLIHRLFHEELGA